MSCVDYNNLSKLDEFSFLCSRCLMDELPDLDFDSYRNIEINPNVINDIEFNNLASAKGLKISHLNVNGLLHKIDEVKIT